MIAQTLPYEHCLTDEQQDAFNQCMETIKLELSGGRPAERKPNPERAIAAIHRFMAAFNTSDEIDRKTPVASLFDVRTANCLERYGIKTIGALICETPVSLEKVPNLGPSTIDLIRLELACYDLYLQGDKPKAIVFN